MRIAAAPIDVIGEISNVDSSRLRLVASSPTGRQEQRLRVLLVEDDDADAYLIRRALAKNPRIGEVVLAHDGVAALELINKGVVNPDLAIVDLHMPRKDGFALL